MGSQYPPRGYTRAMPAVPADPMDFLDIDSCLDDAERATRLRVRAFVEATILPEVDDWFQRGEFPGHLPRAFGEAGLLGMGLSGYGCAGASPVQAGLASMEVEAGDSGIRAFMGVQSELVMYPILHFGSDALREEWLPRLASGEAVGCFCLTEPQVGSDPSGMSTSATRDRGDWILNGHKRWNTNGLVSDVSIVWARTEDGIRGFVVRSDAPGMRFVPIDNAWSIRAAARSELFLEGVRVPGESVLGGTGLGPALAGLTEARYAIAWGGVGAARACYGSALGHARTREQFGRPLAAFQLSQRKLVEMAAGINVGYLLALHLGRLKEQGRMKPEHASMGKLINARMALRTARSARSILGGDGVTFDHPVIRHLANLESVVTYEGSEEVQTLIVGAAITGERAFT